MQNIKTLKEAIEIQEKASNPENNIYLSASAGTGKTKVLSDRVLRLLLLDAEIGNILCLTYTNVAAAEMKNRVIERMKFWHMAQEEELFTDLKLLLNSEAIDESTLKVARSLYIKSLDNLEKFRIQTIHSLALQLINQLAGKKYEIIDKFSRHQFLKEAFLEVINLYQESQEFGVLISYYDLKEIENLILLIIQYSAESVVMTNDDKILEMPVVEPYDDPILSIWIKEFHAASKYEEIWLTKALQPRKNLVTKSMKESNPTLTDRILQEQERVYEIVKERLRINSNNLNISIRRFAFLINRIYSKMKEENNLRGYEDLIPEAVNMLKISKNASWLLYNIDLKLDHILVDEAQDLSIIQWELIKILSEEFFAGIGARDINRTIFIVGDFKQSIYSFQGARPKHFLSIMEYYKAKVIGAKKPWLELDINISFRSTAPVLEAVDKIFMQEASNMGLASNTEVLHKPFRQGGGVVEILDIEEKEQKLEEKSITWDFLHESYGSIRTKDLATRIATMIEDWLNSKRLLKGHAKTIEAKDIMILLKKRSSMYYDVISALRRRGIMVAIDKFDLNDHLIVQDMVAIITFCLYPKNELNLAGLLKSPFFGFTDAQLVEIAYDRGELNLFDSLMQKYPEVGERLDRIKNFANSTPSVFNFLYDIIEDNRHKIAMRFEYAHDVLNTFLSAVFLFETKYYNVEETPQHNLAKLIDWINISDIEVKNTAKNGVKVMTVHSAKGLQAPIVILADAASSEQAPYESVLYSEEDGMAYINFAENNADDITKALKERMKKEREEENLRLLYVAMTRAEDELYLCGWQNNKIKDSWYSRGENVQ